MILPSTRSGVALALVACAASLMLTPAPAGNQDLLLALLAGRLGWLSLAPSRAGPAPP